MNDDYFDQKQHRKRTPKPPVTDTAGDVVKRVGPIALRRILDNPTNIVSEGPDEYALVWSEYNGVGIMRSGTNIRTAEFSLICVDGRHKTFTGAAGRDKAIAAMLRIIKKGKVYDCPGG